MMVSMARRPTERADLLDRLSQDHDEELAHAGRLRRAAEQPPEQRNPAALDYTAAFLSDTLVHFRHEEERLFPIYVRHAGTTPLLQRILTEHMELQGLVRTLRTHAVAGGVSRDELRSLADLVEQHVHVEQDELFTAIRAAVPAHELDAAW
jgi:hemerythrin-like domain-containing protein